MPERSLLHHCASWPNALNTGGEEREARHLLFVLERWREYHLLLQENTERERLKNVREGHRRDAPLSSSLQAVNRAAFPPHSPPLDDMDIKCLHTMRWSRGSYRSLFVEKAGRHVFPIEGECFYNNANATHLREVGHWPPLLIR